MFDHLQQPGVGSEEVLPEVGTALDKVFLILAIGDLAHSSDQQAVAIVLNERIPIAAPDDLNYVPARTAENRFQFLNDFAVPAHGAVEALQVTVHHENEIVQTFARGESNRTKGFRLVHFAIAEKCPYLPARGLFQSTVLKVLDEARVVDRLNRPKTHRDRRELPEILHKPWVRVR